MVICYNRLQKGGKGFLPLVAVASQARGYWFKSGIGDHAEVAEWQTRYVQGVVSVRAWEFKSPLRHITILALVAQLDRAQPCGG